MNKKILENLGLNKNEINIYLILLNKGSLNISEISKEIKLTRAQIYSTLPSMLESGLISEIIKGKRKYYLAQNPKILKEYLNKVETDFNYIYSELEETYNKRDIKPSLQSLNGKKGIKYIFSDIINTLEKGEVFYRYSSRKNLNMKGYIPEDYKELREEKLLERYVITNDFLRKNKIPRKARKEVVVIPKSYDLFEDDILKIIYKDKVAIIDYNSNQGFIIQNPIFANFEKKLFKLLFKFLKN